MKKLKGITYIIISLFLLQVFVFFSIQDVKANGIIPSKYSQSLDLSNTYIYNISFWGGEDPAVIRWEGFDWGVVHGYANSSTDGQIHFNFTGFYNKHIYDWGLFESLVPYLNISFYEFRNSLLVQNSSFYNFSSSETSMIMGLGFNTFFAGFLIPIDNINWLIQQAYAQSSGFFENATVTVNEYVNMIHFDFSLSPGGALLSQNTSLIYDKNTGLLVWARVEMEGGAADFEFFLDGYEFEQSPNPNYYDNYEKTYIYNVTFWGGEDPAVIRWEGFDWGIVHGYVNSSAGGQIHVNYSGFYNKHIYDWSLFSGPMPYIDISFYENQNGFLVLNSTIMHFSTSEVSMIMGLGFNSFFAGFFIPIHNFTWLIQQAYAQASGFFENATVSVDEYLNMIKFDFSISPGSLLLSQNTSLIYDKTTGVLLWAKVEIEGGAADYEIELEGYDYNWPESNNNPEIESYHIHILFITIGVISLVIIFKIKKQKN